MAKTILLRIVILSTFIFLSTAKADDHFLNGMASLECSGTMIKLGIQPGQIYLLTNGHCWKQLLNKAYSTNDGGIVHNQIKLSSPLQIKVFANYGLTRYLPFSEVTYATMLDTDIALFKSDLSEAEINQNGIKIFSLDENEVQPNDSVRITSGYWQDTRSCFVKQKIFQLKEFVWTWNNGFSLTPECNIKGGWSGSPVLSRSGKIIGIINTLNEKNLDDCSLSNPCEIDTNGRTKHQYRTAYAQRTQDILSCVQRDGVFDLSLQSCRLPKPENQFFVAFKKPTMTAEAFQSTLNHLNSKIAPVVKEKFGKHFLATGDWPKEYSKTSSGGSFYHPEISGVSTPDSWGVHITGWLAREPGFQTDAMEFTLCHELGHHIYGGSGEEESDNFAPSCLSWSWTDKNNHEWYQIHKNSIKTEHREQCQEAQSNELMAFCLRTLNAFEPVEIFRGKVWQQMGISNSDVKRYLQERKAKVLEGIFRRNF